MVIDGTSNAAFEAVALFDSGVDNEDGSGVDNDDVPPPFPTMRISAMMVTCLHLTSL